MALYDRIRRRCAIITDLDSSIVELADDADDRGDAEFHAKQEIDPDEYRGNDYGEDDE